MLIVFSDNKDAILDCYNNFRDTLRPYYYTKPNEFIGKEEKGNAPLVGRKNLIK